MSRLVNEKGEPFVDDALEGFTPTDYYKGFKEGYECGYQKARETFEPKHGRWVIEPDATVMHCNVCGWVFEYYGGLEEEWNNCPHCGALMDEVEE